MIYPSNKKLLDISKILLSCFLFLLPWQTIWIVREIFWEGAKWEYGTIGFYFSEIFLWAFVFCGFWLFLREKIIKFDTFKQLLKQNYFLAGGFFLFFVYIFLSLIWSQDVLLALQKAKYLVEAFVLFFLLINLKIEESFIIKRFSIGLVLPILLGAWQFLFQKTFSSVLLGLSLHFPWEAGSAIISGEKIGRWLRAYGSFSHPNILGGYVFALIISLLFLAYNKKENSLTLFAKLVLPCIVLFFSFSRAAWLGLAIFVFGYTIVVFLKSKEEISRTLFYLFFLVLTLVVVFFPVTKNRFFSSSVYEANSINERTTTFLQSQEIFKKNFLLGVGGGNYTLALKNLYPNFKAWEYQPVHNTIFLFLVEYGVSGLFLLAFSVRFLVKKIKIGKRDEAILIYLAVASFLFIAFFDHYLFSFYSGILLLSLFFTVLWKMALDKKT